MPAIAHHELQIGETRQTLKAWGITDCTVAYAALRGDTLTFRQPADVGTDAAIASKGDLVKLYDPSGACRFVGYARTPKPVVNGDEEAYEFTVRGADEWLERIPFTQTWKVPAAEPGDPVGTGTLMTTVNVAQVILFRNGTSGAKVDLYDQLEAILSQAVTYCDDRGRTLQYDLSHIPKDTSPFTDTTNVEPPEDAKRDLSILDAIESCLRWVPYVTARWDYTSGWPKIRFSAARAINNAGELIVGGEILGEGFTARTADVSEVTPSAGAEVTTGIAAVPLDDRCVKKVTISYLYRSEVAENEEGDGPYPWQRVSQDVSNVDNGEFGEILITPALRDLVWNGVVWTDPEPQPPDGLARALHQAFARVWWKFDILRTGQEVNWDYLIGEGWNVDGLGSGPDEANAVAQQIVRDVMTGTTRIVCGPPSHLGYDDLLALLLPNRLRTMPTKAGDQQYGFGEPEKKAEDENIDVEDLWITADGLPVQYRFKAKRL
jgi:hypothetical protein